MQLQFHQTVAAPPAVVFALVTEPELMSRWSRAAVRLLAPGDGGGAGGIGAYREVVIELLGRRSKLFEVIVEARPPHRLEYRVVDVPFVVSHRGVIDIEARAGGAQSALRWDVSFELALPGMALVMERVLRAQLGASLKALAELAPSVVLPAVASSAAKSRPELDDTPDASLWTEAERVLAEQRALAEEMERAGDPKRWFGRVYEYVTEAQVEAARLGAVRHVAWVLRLVPKFHAYYLDNLHHRTGLLAGPPESHWVAAFDAMEGGGRKQSDPRRALFFGLLGGIRAHIEDDLPRALAEVYARHYQGRCDYARFRADYLSMGRIFRGSSARLLEKIPRDYLPWYTRWFGGFIPDELAENMRRKNFYDIPRARRQAFERGARLVPLLLR